MTITQADKTNLLEAAKVIAPLIASLFSSHQSAGLPEPTPEEVEAHIVAALNSDSDALLAKIVAWRARSVE